MSRAMPCEHSNANRNNYGENEEETIKIINNISPECERLHYSLSLARSLLVPLCEDECACGLLVLFYDLHYVIASLQTVVRL